MSKELEALERLINEVEKDSRTVSFLFHDIVSWEEDKELVKKALIVLEILNKRGIKLIIPEGTFSKEHIDIQLFTNCLSKDEFELIKEVLDL